MKAFICYRHADKAEVSTTVSDLRVVSENAIAILEEPEHSEDWKTKAEKKISEADFIIFLLGSATFDSDSIKWEFAKAKDLNKQIVGISLVSASAESVLFCQGFQVFETPAQCFLFLKRVFEHNRQLLIEQYKIMVGSTEKVTEQRLRVNNLFFAVTSAIFSASLIVGKAFRFSDAGIMSMATLTIVAFVITFFWEKLIRSYGCLNKGKFIVIDQIEKQLRSNMFEHEWQILKKQIGYESNTETEVAIVRLFRYLILMYLILGVGYLIYRMLNHIRCLC